MKELSIEEKAKRYDEAIERAEKWRNAPNVDKIPTFANRVIDEIFPEFEENEDKRIRKEIIDFLELPHPQFVGKRDHKTWITWLEKQGEQKPNPYSGTSFDYNGHTWGMCARDNGVELLLDGELKAFLSLEKSFIYPIHSQSELAPKSALEAAKEEKVDNANKVEPKDYNDIDPHFGKPTDKVEPFDKYEGLTDFEKTLADICMGWIGEEHGWKQYIKDNADVLLRIAVKMFNSVQDAPFEQEPADKIEPKFHKGEWDAKKKEPKKIDSKPSFDVEIPFGAKDSELEEVFYSIPNGFHAEIEDDKVIIKKGEKKPTEWSEEDEEYVKDLVDYFTGGLSLKHAEEDITNWLKSLKSLSKCKSSNEHYELEEFAKIVRCNLTGISKAVQKLFEAKYLQLTGNKIYGGFKD